MTGDGAAVKIDGNGVKEDEELRPFSEITAEELSGLRFILTDIDDTITSGGKLTAEAYSAMWALHEAGFGVVPVTGRPAGWCSLIVREWPVAGVVGENGAFAFYLRDGKFRELRHPNVSERSHEMLKAVTEAVLKEVPGSRLSADQFSHIYDLAIDYCEDEPKLSIADAEKIAEICRSFGAQAKVSSIHVNTWFGDYSKREMALLFFKDVLGAEDPKRQILYFGDSPNDESMFEYFPLSCGVANIRPFAHAISHLPAFVTEREGGRGFAEAAAVILDRKAR